MFLFLIFALHISNLFYLPFQGLVVRGVRDRNDGCEASAVIGLSCVVGADIFIIAILTSVFSPPYTQTSNYHPQQTHYQNNILLQAQISQAITPRDFHLRF
jgi:hypothetical protein